MLKNVGSLLVISLLLCAPVAVGQGYDSKEVSMDVIHPENNKIIFFEYKKADKTQYFSIDILIQVKPVNVILLLDESSSMNNKDIEDIYGIASVSRMEIQKRISRQILESVNSVSEIALVFFGGNEIRQYAFGSDRELLKSEVDDMVPHGDKSRGGEGLSQAIDIAKGSGRHCIVIVISDGLELLGEYKLVDSIGDAVNNDIVVHSVLLGKVDTGYDMAQIATKTNGLFFRIEEEEDISSMMSKITNPVNGQCLEDVVLRLVAPSGVYIDDTTTLQGDKPQLNATKLKWDRISYEEPVALKTKIGVQGGRVDRNFSSLEPNFMFSFRNRFQGKDQEVQINIGTVGLDFETEEEYEERIREEFFEKNKLYIGLTMSISVIVVFFIIKRKINMTNLRKELEYHKSQVPLLEDKRDYESAMHHVERAIFICSKLKDDREKELSRKYRELTGLVSQLKEEKAKAEALLNEISRLTETIRKFAPSEYLQHSLSDYNILEEKMGPHLRIDRLGHRASQIFEENELAQIKDLQEELEHIREVLSVNLRKVQRAKDLYEQTKPTLEILLQGNNLDNERVSHVIEDSALASSVLNLVIADHQELKSRWNNEIIDEIKDEKRSFLKAQELMNQGDFRNAEIFLEKALEIAQKTEQYDLAEEIYRKLSECKERIQEIHEEMISSFNEGMELFKNHLYSDAMTKFFTARTLAEHINDASQVERAKSMILRCEKGDIWEEQKTAIRKKMEEVNGVASIEWLTRYVEVDPDDMDRLLRDIRDEFNRKGDQNIEQYRVYRYESIPIFIDFYALSKYLFDHAGEIGGKIPPNNLEIPIDVQNELLELMRPSRGGKR